MIWVTVDKISQYEDQEVELRGWISNRRSSGKIRFLHLRDGHGIIQCVIIGNQVSPEAFEEQLRYLRDNGYQSISLYDLNRHLQRGDPLPEKPVIFTRFADTQVGHGQPLVRPRSSERFDYEGELAVVIGNLPPGFGYLADQLRRASSSVLLKIASHCSPAV